jgi:hypothetical protein
MCCPAVIMCWTCCSEIRTSVVSGSGFSKVRSVL